MTSGRRHFSRFRSKIEVPENRRHKYSFKAETDWFSTKHADWTCLSISQISDFFLENLKIEENNYNKMAFLKISETFFFIKKRDKVKTPCGWTFVQNFKSISWKNGYVFPFWMLKMTTFYIITKYGHFFRFSNFARFSPFKKCSRVIFVFFTKIWPDNIHHTTQIQNFKFDLFLTSWPWVALI